LGTEWVPERRCRPNYHCHPIRSSFGTPGSTSTGCAILRGLLLNDWELPAQDVAHQLGHTDGGALVLALSGHPDKHLARRRVPEKVDLGGTILARRGGQASVTRAP
jgi:hypothetical protein